MKRGNDLVITACAAYLSFRYTYTKKVYENTLSTALPDSLLHLDLFTQGPCAKRLRVRPAGCQVDKLRDSRGLDLGPLAGLKSGKG